MRRRVSRRDTSKRTQCPILYAFFTPALLE